MPFFCQEYEEREKGTHEIVQWVLKTGILSVSSQPIATPVDAGTSIGWHFDRLHRRNLEATKQGGWHFNGCNWPTLKEDQLEDGNKVLFHVSCLNPFAWWESEASITSIFRPWALSQHNPRFVHNTRLKEYLIYQDTFLADSLWELE